MPYIHEVFTLSGVPKVTFVEPLRYREILSSMRTPGRCMVLEGPSGIGKSSIIEKVLDALDLRKSCSFLRARKSADAKAIAELPDKNDIGVVIIDDFHRLDDDVKRRIADFMKVLADSEDENSKLVLIGINKAGQHLVTHSNDLGLRIDVFKLESNPHEKVVELITRGEDALNITVENKQRIAFEANGSFQIAQLLCHKLCTSSNIDETLLERRVISTTSAKVIDDVMVDLARLFKNSLVLFARGSKLRKEGRAPYLHLLKWLAESDDWSLDLNNVLNVHPENKQSISQVWDKGYLEQLISEPDKNLSDLFHFETSTGVLTVEDPRLVFYLKHLVWRVFTRDVGYTAEYFESEYDFAFSFAGANRAHAKMLFELLVAREVSCFYDENEQHRIIAMDVEEYLAPIYSSEARYVIPFLSSQYPHKIWTKFESDNFKERFGQNAIIPLRYTDTAPGYFSEEHKYGALSFDPNGDVVAQLDSIAETLCRRLIEDRRIRSEAALADLGDSADPTDRAP
ncbi:MAG: AAA family ATPase [Herbaspirillum huttiense]|uniref:AAA family ATPase n=1 Tax=Herbaspirillum huttiense TaxID=863372 RepID=UPI001ACE00EA|nr:AAA family ATPase [Herbaspirillum huttiense]MBN9359666.1 AAA family ATPase [Herbaspirillum huttiense]